MQNKKHLVKIGLLFAVIIACGIFIWQASAGVWKFDSTKSTVAKINTQQVGRYTGGLVGYWTFDGQDTNWTANTTSDKSGNNNTGTMINMSTSTSPQPGKIGQALNFDGVSSYVNMGDKLDIERTDPASFSFWIRMNSVGTGQFIIAKEDNYNVAEGYDIRLRPTGVIQFFLCNNQSTSYIATYGNSALVVGNWYHVVVTYDGSSLNTGIKIYINGIEESSYTRSGTLNDTTLTSENFQLGCREGCSFSLLNGVLDEVRIYSRALSAAEIQEQYNAGAETHINP